MQDRIIQEINEFFLLQGFERAAIDNMPVFLYENGHYYYVSKGTDSDPDYYLEAASSLEDAKAGLYEDAGAYKSSLGAEAVIAMIKDDIKKYIVEEYQREAGNPFIGLDIAQIGRIIKEADIKQMGTDGDSVIYTLKVKKDLVAT